MNDAATADLPDVVIAAPIALEVATLDECLVAVTTRSTVYAREILDPLSQIQHPAAQICAEILRGLVSRAEGEEYLHARDFLDPLLDLRNAMS